LFLILLISLNTACLQVPSPEEQKQSLPQSQSFSESGELQIYFPYVGQGDSTLIQLPSKKYLLIDASNPQSAKEELIPFLEAKGVKKLEALIISHYDLDHLGGLQSLAEAGIEITQLYDRGSELIFNENTYTQYLSQALELDLSPIPLQAGETLNLSEEVEIKVLASSGEVLGENKIWTSLDLSPESYSSRENASSLALLIEYGNFRYLTSGDLTGGKDLDGFLSPDMESLVAASLKGTVDVVHANHHGSLSSSNQNFILATLPEAVIIQAGIHNFYGHPHPQVIQAWQSIGAKVYSTDEGKGYAVFSDGLDWELSEIAAP
ncbi:MAG: MBL fold metallo-hydrolase, partial [Deltaproteobacteria bacterium]|nr:MBL fold metallo-hydrolase [Deltaproteobacteria bacterium]